VEAPAAFAALLAQAASAERMPVSIEALKQQLRA